MQGIRPLLIAWMFVEGAFLLLWEIQLIWYLVEVIGSEESSFTYVATLLYFMVYTAVYYGYVINLGVQCLPFFTSTMTELEPIGRGFEIIWRYFTNNAKAAAGLVLMFEIVRSKIKIYKNYS